MKFVPILLWHIATCIQARSPSLPPPRYDEVIDKGPKGRQTVSFKTEDVVAPAVSFLQWNPECDDGLYYFLTPRGKSMRKHQPGPMILNSRGELIWAHHYDNFYGGEGYNFMMQSYRGKDHLTFWVGEDRVKGHGAGINYIVNSSYDVVDKFRRPDGLWADLHEFLLTKDNTALTTVYQSFPKDLSRLPDGKVQEQESGYIFDCLVQETDLRSKQLKWHWRASDHVDISESYRPILEDGTKEHPFDWFHINSVQKDELANYLISARFTHGIIYIDGKTKKTVWQLGGKRNSFMDLSSGNATNFAWQHDARLHSADAFPSLYIAEKRAGFTTKLLTLFDNAGENEHFNYGLPLSRGLLLEVTYPTPGTREALAGAQNEVDKDVEMSEFSKWAEPHGNLNAEKIKAINGSDPNYTVRVVTSYDNPHRIRSSSQGDVQLIPQGPNEDPRVLVGYGLVPAWTEFASNGTALCDAHFHAKTAFESGKLQSYRVLKFPWTGRPRWRPKVFLESDLYVSWIGATEVSGWAVQASSSDTTTDEGWSEVVRVRKTRFEEVIAVPAGLGDVRFLRAIALDRNGVRMQYGVSESVYRGYLATHFPKIYDQTPRFIRSITPLLATFIVIGTIVLFLVLYRVFQWYSSRRKDRPGAGLFGWRNDIAYQPLGQSE